MHNGHHAPHPTQPQQPPRSITGETEIRHLPFDDIKQIGNILQEGEEWKKLMRIIPGAKEGGRRFDMSDVDILDNAMRKDTTHTGFELLIDNWGTMEEWGRSDGGRTHRPRVKDLGSFCRQIDNYRAASYVNHEILGGEPLQRPVPTDDTEDFTLYPNECSQASLSMEVLTLEDVMLEDTIESAEENSDFIDCPLRPEHGLNVPYVKYSYLFNVTNYFDQKAIIGKGGFSEVYKGVTRRKQIPLAIKKLNQKSEDAKKLMNFEVEHLPRLKHRNIIDLYGYSNDSVDSPCLIYPFMENGTLNGILKHDDQHPKHLNSKQRLDISKGIAEGICYIHSLQTEPTKMLIHRDIKSSNILLDDKMTPKVADFGLLRLAVSGNDIESTCTVNCKGTPAYMPPEAYFRNDVSAKWDVWSFGVVLLEVLTSLPVIDTNREERDIVTHVNSHIEDRKPLKDLLDPCWDKDDMIGLADSIYNIAHNRCMEMDKRKRASSEEVIEEFKKL